MATSKKRVLVVYGSESGHAKRTIEGIVRDWSQRPERQFEIVSVCSGEAALKELPLCEDDNNELHYDLAVMRQLYDAIIVCTSSYGEGDPPENFAPFFLELLNASETGHKPLAGIHHAILGEGSSVYEVTFQNVPRLTDQYLGSCGSRRLVMRQEIDEAAYGDADTQRKDRIAFKESVFEALQALPNASAPAACEWTEANKSHTLKTDFVSVKSTEYLSGYRPSTKGGTHRNGCDWILWLIVGPLCAFLWLRWVLRGYGFIESH